MTHNEDTEKTDVELHSVDYTITATGDRKATKDEYDCEQANVVVGVINR